MKPPTIQDILNATADQYGVHPAFILQDTRKKEVIKLRHIAQYLSRRFTPYSYEEIGTRIANRDHATSLHACKKMQFQYETYNEERYFINKIIERMEARGLAVERDYERPVAQGDHLGKTYIINHCSVCGSYKSITKPCKKCKQ